MTNDYIHTIVITIDRMTKKKFKRIENDYLYQQLSTFLSDISFRAQISTTFPFLLGG